MIKYAKITNEETGRVIVGLDDNIDYYKSIGMVLLDVDLSDIDNAWYLADKCPHKPEEQKLREAKEIKYNEANKGAKIFLEDGNALFEFEEGKHIEATDGNIAKLTAYALAYVTGQLQPSEYVVWNTKEDETVELTSEQVAYIIKGLGFVQTSVWSVQFPAYVQAIEAAETVEEVEAIEVNYYSEEPIGEAEDEL